MTDTFTANKTIEVSDFYRKINKLKDTIKDINEEEVNIVYDHENSNRLTGGSIIGIQGEKVIELQAYTMNHDILKLIIELEITKDIKYISFEFDSSCLELLKFFPSLKTLKLTIEEPLLHDPLPDLTLSSLHIEKKSNIPIPNIFESSKNTLLDLSFYINDGNDLTNQDSTFLNTFNQLITFNTNISDLKSVKLENLEKLFANHDFNLSSIGNLPSLTEVNCEISHNSGPLPKNSILKKLSIKSFSKSENNQFYTSLFSSKYLEELSLECNQKIQFTNSNPNLKKIELIYIKEENPFSENFDFEFDFNEASRLEHVREIRNNNIYNIDLYELLELHPSVESIRVSNFNITSKSSNDKFNLITTLSLEYCKLHSLRFINSFPNLTMLKAPGNFISKLGHLKNKTNLEHVNLFNNNIMNIPKEYGDNFIISEYYSDDVGKGGKSILIVGNNPLVNPSLEIIRRGAEAQQSYFKSMQGEIEELNEAKIIFLGPGSVGKTSLMKCLSGKPFDPQEDTTHGINIEKYPIRLQNGSIINAKIWDFGGQQINHTTHQLFLSQRCVYVLVINDRINDEPQDQKIDYWLQQVKAFGGDSKVIIVRNKCEQFKHSNLQEGLLRSKFRNITQIESVSCKENINIEQLRERLNEEVAKLPMRQMQLPKNWLEVKNEVQCIADELDHFSLTKFREICIKHRIVDDIAQQTLQDLLNDLSLIIVFPELAAYDMGVLNPYWITDGIYSIINCRQFEKQKGLVTQEEVQGLLDELHPERYKHKAKFIIDSLLKFELCHSVGTDNSNNYLVPSLLPPLDKKIELNNKGKVVSLIFSYENLLPKSIFTKFLVRMNKDISADCRWKSAAILTDISFNSKALVIEDDVNKTITITVKGEQARDYFSVIRKTINDLNYPDTNKLGVKELVILPRSNGASIPYAELLGYEAEGEETYLHGITRKRYNVSKLLSGIESRQDTAIRVNELNQKDITVNVTNNIENNSTATNTTTTTQEQTTKQSVNITIDLQLFKGSAQNVITDLKDDLADEIEDEKSLRRVTRECNKVQTAIDDIQGITTPEEALEKAGSFERLRSFFDGALKGNSSIGEHLKTLRDTTGQIKEVAKKYNSIASYFGFPTIPEVLL
ncbi:hypothetical protein CWN85_10515 [Vibrio splendidus]|uniref:COR domain-containing protein n=1 Tax=Vibrio splendidus TaxID=29497 RepID=UPI000D385FDC|nr:COR domain-containing protein [Vibrio splendidus]PTP09655.1 hypothetical protein CWN86_03160 [Vibrio splendidus]PTP23965.1 hypothetical protein CWN85_10515 [Vibrio splendidus]